MKRNKTRIMNKTVALTTAVAATLVPALANRVLANTVDGTVSGGEYGTTLASQTAPTGFGNTVLLPTPTNGSELNQAFANYTPGGALELALTGNLETGGNGLVIFIDSRAGGGIANSVGGGFGQFGSVSGSRTDDWGTDTDGSVAVTPTPGGASILAPNFNPDYSIEINSFGGSYYINIIDLTLPNEPDINGNRDVYLGTNTVNGAGVTQTYFRDLGFTDAGDITHAFDNTNVDGVNGYDFGTPPGPTGDPSTATKGFEFLFEDQFIDADPGQAVRILPFITNGSGDYLANQFLPGVFTDGNLEGPGSGPGGIPLFDSRVYNGDQFYLPLFVPTKTAGTTWASATFTGGAIPNGAEQAAKLADGSAASIDLGAGVTLGYLELDNPAGYTFTGASGMSFNGGNGASALIVTSGPQSFTNSTTVTSDTRVRIASGASVTLNGLAIAANKRITQAGDGTLTIGGTMANGAGSSIAADQGTLVLNSDIGTGLAIADRPDLYVATTGTTLANLNVSQKLDQLAANPNGTIILAAGGNKTIEANQVFHSGTGKLDLKDGDLVVHNTPVGSWNGSIYTDITGMVAFGRNGGVWDNSGITTSMPDATGGSGYTSLGVASGQEARGLAAPTDTDVWNGVTITGTDTLVMYTYGGDANLSGDVDVDDYGLIDFNAAIGGVLTGWYNGDFDYNGVQDVDDYGIIDFVVAIQGPNLGSAGGLGIAAVPEPGSISLLAIGATALLGRRRRAK